MAAFRSSSRHFGYLFSILLLSFLSFTVPGLSLTIQKLFNMNEIIDENELDGSE